MDYVEKNVYEQFKLNGPSKVLNLYLINKLIKTCIFLHPKKALIKN